MSPINSLGEAFAFLLPAEALGQDRADPVADATKHLLS